jgi:phosphatidylglycerophosphatase A
MPIYSLTKEKYDEIMQKIKDLKIELKTIKSSDPKQWYIDELKELLRKV